MYKRNYLSQLEKRIREPRRFIQVITGPRQVGKTTLVHQLLETLPAASLYESADGISGNPELWIANQWDRARRQLGTSGNKEMVLCLDEVQKIEGWSEFVKREWDADSRNRLPLKVILLGSSRLLIQEGLTESLAGRFETISMTHWKYAEMKQAFGMDPESYVYHGGYPGAASLIHEEPRWRTYVKDSLVETTLSRDIFLMSRIRKPALLKRLFEVGVSYSGQIISFNKILGQLQDAGNTVTLAHYLHLLDVAGLIKGVEKYSSQDFRKRSSSPKFQVYNPALSGAYMQESPEAARNHPDIWGQLVESAVGTHLVNHATESGYKVYYWRERNREVDFIIEKEGRLAAIEVKSGKSKPVKGLEAFGSLFHPEHQLIVGTGGIPWEEFLEQDPGTLF